MDQTVLANEQVIDGKGGVPEQLLSVKIKRVVFNISKFSEDLLESLNKLDNWPNKVKTMQKNWIGKSFGWQNKF